MEHNFLAIRKVYTELIFIAVSLRVNFKNNCNGTFHFNIKRLSKTIVCFNVKCSLSFEWQKHWNYDQKYGKKLLVFFWYCKFSIWNAYIIFAVWMSSMFIVHKPTGKCTEANQCYKTIWLKNKRFKWKFFFCVCEWVSEYMIFSFGIELCTTKCFKWKDFWFNKENEKERKRNECKTHT